MISKLVKVQNRAGIHARPAAIIVRKANEFVADIFLEKESSKINAKSVIGLLTMAASYGTEINLICDGPDEDQALEAINYLFDNKFEED